MVNGSERPMRFPSRPILYASGFNAESRQAAIVAYWYRKKIAREREKRGECGRFIHFSQVVVICDFSCIMLPRGQAGYHGQWQ